MTGRAMEAQLTDVVEVSLVHTYRKTASVAPAANAALLSSAFALALSQLAASGM